MSQSSPSSPVARPGWLTLAFTFVFVALFRIEQNVAYAFDMTTEQLVTVDVFPLRAIVQLLGPFLHATPGHLVSTLVWFVPFGYFLERRASAEDYVLFVVVTGLVTTMLVPSILIVLGVPVGLGVGASGITHALVGREAAARGSRLRQFRSFGRTRRGILVVALVGAVLAALGVVTELTGGADATGHVTGLLLGILVGVGERRISFV